MPKPIYPMSRVGGCPRAIVAEMLGNEVVPALEFMDIAAREGNRHEQFIAEDLRGEGWTVGPPGRCEPCDRNGFHVELDFPAFKLVGHYDRMAWHDVYGQHVTEFKALGRFRATKLFKAFATSSFRVQFQQYAVQASLYMAATKLPLLYVVKNRDTGRLDWGLTSIPEYSLTELQELVSKIELARLKGKPPVCRHNPGDFERTICPVRYMCSEGPSAVPMLVSKTVIEIAAEYREAHVQLAHATSVLDPLRAQLLDLHKTTGQRVLAAPGFKSTLVQPDPRTTYPKGKLEKSFTAEELKGVAEVAQGKEYVKVDLEEE